MRHDYGIDIESEFCCGLWLVGMGRIRGERRWAVVLEGPRFQEFPRRYSKNARRCLAYEANYANTMNEMWGSCGDCRGPLSGVPTCHGCGHPLKAEVAL